MTAKDYLKHNRFVQKSKTEYARKDFYIKKIGGVFQLIDLDNNLILATTKYLLEMVEKMRGMDQFTDPLVKRGGLNNLLIANGYEEIAQCKFSNGINEVNIDKRIRSVNGQRYVRKVDFDKALRKIGIALSISGLKHKFRTEEIMESRQKRKKKEFDDLADRQKYKYESEFQKAVLDYLVFIGAEPVKVSVANVAGVSDILACYKGRFIAIEVKLTADVDHLQMEFIERIKSAGGIGFVLQHQYYWTKVIDKKLEGIK